MGLPRTVTRTGGFRRATITPNRSGKCRRKFLRFFPDGFRDETYIAWERGYKEKASRQWEEQLGPRVYAALLKAGSFTEIAQRAVRIESRTNLLFSFEKMGLRDAVKPRAGAELFAKGLYEYLHGHGPMERRFERWCDVAAQLPRKQARVLTWPVVTVFGFMGRPQEHIFLKPTVTRVAAEEYDFEFSYAARPNWETYASLLRFGETVRRDLRGLGPRDMIDIQSFIWVQGSDEYAE